MAFIVDQAVPLLVTEELEDKVEDEEDEHARDEEKEYGDVHEHPPEKGVLPKFPLGTGGCVTIPPRQLVEGRIILVGDQTTPGGRERRIPM